MRSIVACLALLLSVTISGCGGGGGDSPPPAPSGNFTLTASVAGVAVGGFSVANGGSGSLSVQSSDQIRLTSTSAVNWTSTLNGATLTPGTIDSTTWDVRIVSPLARTVTLTATSTVDGSKPATVTIAVAAQRYAATVQTLGRISTYAQTNVFNDNSQEGVSYTNTVVAINADASYSVAGSVNGAVTSTVNNTATGARVSRNFVLNSGGTNPCTYTPPRAFFDYPLYVGKSYASTWNYQCAAGYRESGSLRGEVVGFESITVPAGTFDALRINVTIDYTNSNDGNLTGGATGAAAYRVASVCWWGVAAGRFLGCDETYTYTGIAPPNYLKTVTYRLSSP